MERRSNIRSSLMEIHPNFVTRDKFRALKESLIDVTKNLSRRRRSLEGKAVGVDPLKGYRKQGGGSNVTPLVTALRIQLDEILSMHRISEVVFTRWLSFSPFQCQ